MDTLGKAEKTKEFIIEKTAPIFNEKGFSGTSLNDILQATSLSKGCIYGNFKNKDEIALSAFDFNQGQINAYFNSKMKEKEHAIDRLLVYPKTFRHFQKLSFFQAGCPILNTATEADDTHPLLRKKAVSALKFWQESIEKIIKKGIENNEIKPETNAQEMALVMISMMEGVVMQAKLRGNSSALKSVMTYLERQIMGLKQ